MILRVTSNYVSLEGPITECFPREIYKRRRKG